ncbi:helix-turn-helix domain-containing protein [Streptomyces turgidiscabies]|uniref:Toxin-antitoxin system, antitoxin component, Xre family n=1 Tax=Streptomyces turgidiscabies (strain Car8) TaxID=698760 RepID=L7FIS2_STRT8|nr:MULTISPECIES: helix-turn-helix transcriptional regulator [Streptomyces]ELP71227.1 toxin-antitoxin system, antitoxin component, Xre family [Streptomyces turgidiscabies Car8]MDX3492557.1 helix-turn-helix transcriptional regulator [Streptomyces turgidiscabies]GAQ69146.1 helix-turn-helix protein [Streptomyces turgidiscabies]
MSVQYNPKPNPNSQPSPGTWRYSGNQLKRWRTKANITREELGAAANYSPDTIKSMEQGVRMPTPRVLDAADELCRADGLLSAAKEYVKREPFPARAQDFMQYEQQAISFWSYEVALIPGLLQTEAYARSLIENRYPPLNEETVEERIAARMERQVILTDRKPPVGLSFVLYEAALRSSQVDTEQLHRLLVSASLRNVVLQVLPFERAISDSLMGPMVLLETREHERLAFAEGPFASDLTADPEVVSRVMERLSMIRAQALNPAESARFLERMVDQP